MKMLALVLATAGAVLCGNLGTSPASAQVGVHVGPGGIYIGPRHRPDCRTVTVTEWHHGARVTRTIQRCGDHDRY